MGAWGAGLYSSDSALDLKASIRALVRLPFDGKRMLELLRTLNAAADDPGDEEHTEFWLVAADQFARHGVRCDEARDRAIKIIQGGTDIKVMRELGMSAADLRRREKKLSELAGELKAPLSPSKAKTLKEPEPLLLAAGSVWAYPTMKRKARNPYFETPESEQFSADGWGALITLAVGRAFDWLAWYAVAPVALQAKTKPRMAEVRNSRFYLDQIAHREPSAAPPILGGVGTLSRTHIKRLGLESIGDAKLSSKKLLPHDIDSSGQTSAVNDISFSNYLDASQASADGPSVAEFLEA
ncbi:MAG: hypothetical protein ACKVS9_00805 [Phycisphaerae bacterium]